MSVAAPVEAAPCWRLAQEVDLAFERRLYASVRAPEFSAFGWDAAAIAAFADGQHDLQHRAYGDQWPRAERWLIEVDDKLAGRVWVDDGEHALHLIDLALLPEHRGRGLGTAILRRLQQRAAARGVPMRLHVLHDNPARRLYRRLDFIETGASGWHVGMQWSVRDGAPAGEMRRNTGVPE